MYSFIESIECSTENAKIPTIPTSCVTAVHVTAAGDTARDITEIVVTNEEIVSRKWCIAVYAPAIKVKSSTMRNPDNLCIRRQTATVQGTASHGHGLSTFWKRQLKLLCLDRNITLNAHHLDTS